MRPFTTIIFNLRSLRRLRCTAIQKKQRRLVGSVDVTRPVKHIALLPEHRGCEKKSGGSVLKREPSFVRAVATRNS
jgi:hypothetical protein